MPVETTYTSLRERLASVLDQVANDHEVVIVRRRGAKDVALIPADELAGLLETAHLLRSPKNAGGDQVGVVGAFSNGHHQFTARAKESGWSETSMRTCGQAARSHRAVPSPEPLSTTTISAANDSSSRAMPGSCASSSSFPLRDGMTTEMPVSAGRGSPGGGLRHLGRNAPATRAVAYQQTVWIRGFKSDQQVPEDPCISGAALVPKSQRLEREGRGHRVHIRQPGPGLAPEIEAA